MRGIARVRLPARQHGAALLILLALVSVALTYAVVAGLNRSAAGMAQERAQKTTTALAQAKEALIAYAVTYADDPSHAKRIPGYLPCPEIAAEIGKEGVAKSPSCDGPLVSQLGRLPWRTLGLGPVTDGSGECLWYAVSGTYKSWFNGVTTDTATSNMMNWDTNGQFEVRAGDGTTYLAGPAAGNRAVAVIFAPGSALSGQNRTPDANAPLCAGNYTAANYLETAAGVNNSVVSTTANALDAFIAGAKSDRFNDQLVYITRADIWSAVKKRSDFNNHLRALTRRAAECTAKYGTHNGPGKDKLLPWASRVSLSTTSIPTYAVDSRYDDRDDLMSGRLSYKVKTSGAKTNNDLRSYDDNYYLFSLTSYCSYTSDQQVWYENWKDQLFYAVAKNFRPATSRQQAGDCPSCLRINASATYYAAVVIFAGEKLSGQSRNTAGDKGSIANYLEAPNSTNVLADTGSGNYQAAATSSSFNDIVYAIDGNLEVKCYNGSTMVSVPAATAAPPADPAAYAACP